MFHEKKGSIFAIQQPCVAGWGGVWQGAAGGGRVRKSVAECGRVWQAAAERRRASQIVADCCRLLQIIADFVLNIADKLAPERVPT